MDTAAWLVLLALFELETGRGDWLHGKPAVVTIRAIRLAAAAAVCLAAAGYLHEKAWLDAVNSWLWITVVIILEFEVRYPRVVKRARIWFISVAAILYAGLAALVAVWAWRGEWFDAYDALLWLIAFLAIEMNVLQNPAADQTMAVRSQ